MGLNVPIANTGRGMQNMQDSSSPALVSFKLRYVRQEELKHITLSYERQEAEQRSYNPQGFFGLLVADLDRSQHFVEVDLDDPFFREFAVSAEVPIDLSQVGLSSVHVSLDYGDPSDPVNHKHADFVFDATDKEKKTFKAFMNADYDTHYDYTVQYNFDPQSEWEGERFGYAYSGRSEDRTSLFHPYDRIAFIEIEVSPHRIDGELIDWTDVLLSYTAPSGWTTETSIEVRHDSAPAFWRLRVEDPDIIRRVVGDERADPSLNKNPLRQFTWRLVHHLKDGTTQESEPVTTSATRVRVIDPFDEPLEVEFLPLFGDSSVRQAILLFTYEDADNGYTRTARLRFTPSSEDTQTIRIARMDASISTFTYQVTVIGADNRPVQRDPVTTDEAFVYLTI